MAENFPNLAWHQSLTKKYHTICLLYLMQQSKITNPTQAFVRIGSFIKGAPAESTVVNLINDIPMSLFERKGVYTVTPSGQDFVFETATQLQPIADETLRVLDSIIADLYKDVTASENVEIGPETLFSNGGIRSLTRTFILHTALHHREIDLSTGEPRVPYFFELMRYVEAKHGWRPSTGIFSKVKNQQIDMVMYSPR
jgi:hypothetical protein